MGNCILTRNSSFVGIDYTSITSITSVPLTVEKDCWLIMGSWDSNGTVTIDNKKFDASFKNIVIFPLKRGQTINSITSSIKQLADVLY